MGRRLRTLFGLTVTVILATGLLQIESAAAEEALPSKSDPSCLKCHDYDKHSNLFAGKFVDVAAKSKTIQLQIGPDMEVLSFDDSTVVKNAPGLKKIPKQESVRVAYIKKGEKNFAKEVEVKKGLEVPKEQLASAEEVAELVAQGPEKEKYVLVDSRPGNMYQHGHIPTAVSMPFFAFDKVAEKILPKSKEVLQIYYCTGFSCVLSPLSAKKAEKLGYKNVKVFHAGLPAWKKAGNVVVSTTSGIEEFNKKEASYILLDLRPAKAVEQGHIPNAVSIPEAGLDSLKSQLPKYMNAAIVLYNQEGDVASATDAAKKIAGWGYKDVSILAGGLQAWEKAGNRVAKGPAASKVTYVRKLMPGEIELDAFKALLAKPSEDFVILDVRAKSEVAEGALPNSVNIPLDELEQHLAELPTNKTLAVHCGTGARAEMAYNVLKKHGLKAKYLKAKVDFDRESKGQYTIEE